MVVDCLTVSCVHYITFFGLIAFSAAMTGLGIYFRTTDTKVFTALLLFASAGMWISLVLSTDEIIMGYSQTRLTTYNNATDTIIEQTDIDTPTTFTFSLELKTFFLVVAAMSALIGASAVDFNRGGYYNKP